MIGSILNIGQAPKDSTKKEKNIRCFTLQIIFIVLFFDITSSFI